MSKTAKFVIVLSLVGFVAACAKKTEEVVVMEPVQAEPTYTKY